MKRIQTGDYPVPWDYFQWHPAAPCICCGGTGKQQRADGIWILCPACTPPPKITYWRN